MRKFVIIIYLISCVLPISNESDFLGFHALLIGMGMLNPSEGGLFTLGLPWLSNIIFITSIVVPDVKLRRLTLSITALLLALPFLLNSISYFEALGPGVYVWYGSYLLNVYFNLPKKYQFTK